MTLRIPPPPRLGARQVYFCALLAPCIGAASQYGLRPYTDMAPFVFFFLAVVCSSWLGGVRAGVLAIAISALVNWLCALTLGTLAFPRGWLSHASFITVAFFINLLSASIRTGYSERDALLKRFRERAQDYRCLADIMPQLVWTTSPEGLTVYCNDRWLTYTGLTLKETLGWTWIHLIHPHDRSRALERWELALRLGSTYETECRLRRSDGSYRWHLCRAVPRHDNAGTLSKWFGTATDIEDYKRVEGALSQTEGRERLARQAAEQAASVASQLQQLAFALAGVSYVKPVADILLEHSCRAVQANSGLILQWQDCTWTVLSTQNTSHCLTSPSWPPLNQILTDTKPSWVSNSEHWRHLGIAAYALIPLVVDDQLLGAIVFLYDQPQTFVHATQDVVLTMAHHSAQALDRARLLQETEHTRARVERERARLYDFLMQAPAIIAVQRAPERTYEFINEPAQQSLGLHGIAALGLAEGIDHVYATGAPYIAKQVPVVLGEARYFNVVHQPIQGSTGNVEYVMTLSVEVTAQVLACRQAEALAARLEREQRWLEAILDAGPVPQLLVDPQTAQPQFANAALTRLGITRPGHNITWANTRDKSLDDPNNPIGSAARGQVWRDVEVVGQRHDGTMISLLCNSVVLPAMHGHQSTVVLTLQDISHLKTVERELHCAIRQRDDFLAAAGHELKTPLTALQLHIQGLQRRLRKEIDLRLYAWLGQRLEQSNSSINRFDGLVNALLDVSRISSGQLRLDPQVVDLGQVIAEVVDRLRDSAAKAGCSIYYTPRGSTCGWWDRLRLEQVVTNLLSNAIKYGGGKPIEIELEDIRDLAIIRITDHGIGIDPAHQSRIFNRFERAVSTREFGGFGLGLWIVRQIVQACGGDISVRSTLGTGSTFIVSLPNHLARTVSVGADSVTVA